MSLWRRRLGRGLLLLIAAYASGCADTGQYVWARDLPQQARVDQGYVIRTGDQLDVRVYNEDRLAGRPRVRSDGFITLPLLGDVLARGKTPAALARDLTALLSKYLNSPTVTVGVDDSLPVTITMIGEFSRPGIYTLNPGSGLVQALALAGGFNDFADRDAFFVMRTNPQQRVRFRYKDLLNNDPSTVGFQLLDGDVVAAE